MLTHRVIPCLDIKNGRVVKGVNFVELRDAGDPVEVAKAYEAQGADELVLLDINASHEGRGIMLDVVRRVAEECFMPFTVGGGVRVLDDVAQLVASGAEKVSINSAAVSRPAIVAETAARFGNCATVVNIDPRRVPRADFEARRVPGTGLTEAADGRVFEVHIHGGRTPTGLDPVSFARSVVDLGAGEIVLTSMDADGTRDGFDIEITRLIGEAVDVPLIASGGCGGSAHMIDVLQQTRADAVLAASIFHYGQCTVAGVKADMAAAGLPVRQARSARA